jgi:hypothetical protein
MKFHLYNANTRQVFASFVSREHAFTSAQSLSYVINGSACYQFYGWEILTSDEVIQKLGFPV